MKKLILLFCCMPISVMAAKNCQSINNVPDYKLSLQDVIELGLCRNPQTTAAYLGAEAARMNKNAGYAPYLPSLNATVGANKLRQNEKWEETATGASLSASYLIFDFGKRLEDLNQLSSVWRATGFDYDDTVQNYVYSVIGAYYNLLNADADVEANKLLKTAAITAKETADKKFKAGAIAKVDVLRAETNLAQRVLALERAENNNAVAAGKLLTLLSFPSNQKIDIMDMPSNFGTDAENKTIDELIALAQKQRPDVLRATANKDAAWHRRNSRFLSNLPSISATATVSYNDLDHTFGIDKADTSIGVRASMPIFAGFANVYGVRSANASYEQAKELERKAQDNADLDIFTAYQNYKTAQNVLSQSETLLKSAIETEKSVGGQYKVGRTTMLDWQNAQADLADAKKQNNAARYDLFIKRAAVALAVGDIKTEMNK